jgi:hypothetical protein
MAGSPSTPVQTCTVGKKENFYITGVPGTPVAAWFRAVLRTKHLTDIVVFPARPSDFYA